MAAIKAALKKSQFVGNNDLTEEELSGTVTYTPDKPMTNKYKKKRKD